MKLSYNLFFYFKILQLLKGWSRKFGHRSFFQSRRWGDRHFFMFNPFRRIKHQCCQDRPVPSSGHAHKILSCIRSSYSYFSGNQWFFYLETRLFHHYMAYQRARQPSDWSRLQMFTRSSAYWHSYRLPELEGTRISSHLLLTPSQRSKAGDRPYTLD